METSLIEEFYYPKKGPARFMKKMAAQILEMGGTILTDTAVNGQSLRQQDCLRRSRKG